MDADARQLLLPKAPWTLPRAGNAFVAAHVLPPKPGGTASVGLGRAFARRLARLLEICRPRLLLPVLVALSLAEAYCVSLVGYQPWDAEAALSCGAWGPWRQ